MKHKGKIFILSGPSGSGKTTLYKKLLSSKRLSKKLTKSISATTRSKRQGETSGRDYIFLSKGEFLRRKRDGYFLEYEKVFDNYYGTPKEAVAQLVDSGKNVLLCIDVKGAKTVSRKFPGAVRIFVKTPTLRDLRRRLTSRGSEGKKSLATRLKRAKKELKEAKTYHHVLTNDDFLKAYKRLENIILKELKNGVR
ncbi:MAG: guanylate kinase [Omnitrophica WOR_2 bacterium GWA2_47_8]|nr:MAG: guanylate kinase [Omnitrophica WOR_2 bacterium GWA2_47_8]